MIICHDSPVEQRKSSKKLVLKSRKFTCSFSSCIGPLIYAKPNRERPITANMKNIMIKRRPSEPSDGAESSNVWKIIFNYVALLRRRRIRPIRSARSMVGPLPKGISIESIFSSSMISVTITIRKSNLFQPSLKYIS